MDPGTELLIERVQTGLTIDRLLSARPGARVLGSQIVHMNSELENYSRNVIRWVANPASKAQMEIPTHVRAIDCRNSVPNVGSPPAGRGPQHI